MTSRKVVSAFLQDFWPLNLVWCCLQGEISTRERLSRQRLFALFSHFTTVHCFGPTDKNYLHFSSISALGVCDQYRTYQHDISRIFKRFKCVLDRDKQ